MVGHGRRHYRRHYRRPSRPPVASVQLTACHLKCVKTIIFCVFFGREKLVAPGWAHAGRRVRTARIALGHTGAWFSCAGASPPKHYKTWLFCASGASYWAEAQGLAARSPPLELSPSRLPCAVTSVAWPGLPLVGLRCLRFRGRGPFGPVGFLNRSSVFRLFSRLACPSRFGPPLSTHHFGSSPKKTRVSHTFATRCTYLWKTKLAKKYI